MPADTFVHFVFVDFENVPKVDLELIEGKPVHVTLLIGKNQGKIDFALVDQIHRLAAQVELKKVGASGHNALDLTLACYLGQAVQRCPVAHFYIVSKDKDFDPMIAHLSGRGIPVVRCDSFAALPFLPKSTKPHLVKAAVPARSGAPMKAAIPVKAGTPDVRLEKLITRLKNSSAPRPKRQSSLLAHINTAFGARLSEAEQAQKVAELIGRGVLIIDAKGRVSYE
jgi:hypothetical protein